MDRYPLGERGGGGCFTSSANQISHRVSGITWLSDVFALIHVDVQSFHDPCTCPSIVAEFDAQFFFLSSIYPLNPDYPLEKERGRASEKDYGESNLSIQLQFVLEGGRGIVSFVRFTSLSDIEKSRFKRGFEGCPKRR